MIIDSFFFFAFVGANATLQQRLVEAQTALRAKEAACLKAEQERDRLAKLLADQADAYKAELQKLKDVEEALQAEFESQLSNWVDTQKALEPGYVEIEDLLDGTFLFPCSACRLFLLACLCLLISFFFC